MKSDINLVFPLYFGSLSRRPHRALNSLNKLSWLEGSTELGGALGVVVDGPAPPSTDNLLGDLPIVP